MAAVAATGGAFAQSVLTGDIAYGFKSVTTNMNTASGFGLNAADLAFNASEDVEGLGKLSASINFASEGGRSVAPYAGDQSITLVTAAGSWLARFKEPVIWAKVSLQPVLPLTTTCLVKTCLHEQITTLFPPACL